MVKFKVGFEIGAETLFGMLAKMLPIDNLHVEEMIERQPMNGAQIANGVKHGPTARKKRRISKGVDLTRGVNGIVMGILNDGQPHRAVEMYGPLKEAGFSENSVSSRLQALRERGLVENIGMGTWRRTAS